MNNCIKKQLIGIVQGAVLFMWLPGILLTNSCNGGGAPDVPNNNNPANIEVPQGLPNNLAPNELIVFCGNPGVGKSSLCNSIFQAPIFRSGISVGRGLTMHKQEHIYEGKLYIDTPGLSDVERREQAAREIEQALRQNNNYKIVFVAKLDGARIRPADLTTINTVCDAIQTNFEYGLIFNQVSNAAINRINVEGGLESYLSTLHKIPVATVILKRDSDMDDAENVYFPNNSEERMRLMNFISELRANRILDREVQEINVRDFQERINELEERLSREAEAAARNQQELLNQQRDLEERLRREAEENRRLIEQQRQEAERLRLAYEAEQKRRDEENRRLIEHQRQEAERLRLAYDEMLRREEAERRRQQEIFDNAVKSSEAEERKTRTEPFLKITGRSIFTNTEYFVKIHTYVRTKITKNNGTVTYSEWQRASSHLVPWSDVYQDIPVQECVIM